MSAARKLGPGDDIEMMKSPDHWPHRWLPLTRRAQLPEGHPARMGQTDLGILVMGGGPIVRLGNIFMPTRETIAYQDFEAIYDAGWRVD